MAEHHTEPWYPTAAYLYTLHLDGPALAWEYLRRNPDYRLDWLRRRRRSDTAHRWGLRLLEDPELDARDAHPAWFPDHDGVPQLYPDADPPMDAIVFAFWSLPGSKCLIHDGKRLMLVLRWPGYSLRLAIAPGLADGMAARAWRLRVPDREIRFVDRIQGANRQNLEREVGDFVLLRADGQYAYQLAVVAADLESFADYVRTHVRSLPGVREISTSFSLKEVKRTMALPL